MISRREVIAGSAAMAAACGLRELVAQDQSIFVNDIHSQLNSTRVLKVLQPHSVEDVQQIIRSAGLDQRPISVAGGRHAMGRQQFGADTLLVDVRKMNRIRHLDRDRGILEVEAGIEWPELINGYLSLQGEEAKPWGIAQKQTGADRITIAGTIAANAHGRGLKMKPFIGDVDSFVLVDSNGTA